MTHCDQLDDIHVILYDHSDPKRPFSLMFKQNNHAEKMAIQNRLAEHNTMTRESLNLN